MTIPGLISPDERELIRSVSERLEESFENPVVVHLGVFMGASCYCSREGSRRAQIVGVDVNDKLDGTGEQKAKLDLVFLQGDTRKIHTEFQSPAHMIFVDATHERTYVTKDIQNWVLQFVPVGGYALFHDAFYEPENAFFKLMAEVSGPIDKLLSAKEWEEQEVVDTIRWFKRIE